MITIHHPALVKQNQARKNLHLVAHRAHQVRPVKQVAKVRAIETQINKPRPHPQKNQTPRTTHTKVQLQALTVTMEYRITMLKIQIQVQALALAPALAVALAQIPTTALVRGITAKKVEVEPHVKVS